MNITKNYPNIKTTKTGNYMIFGDITSVGDIIITLDAKLTIVGNITAYGDIICSPNNLNVRGDVKAANLTCNGRLNAHSILVEHEIFVDGSLISTGDIIAGDKIEVGHNLKADGIIYADGDICCIRLISGKITNGELILRYEERKSCIGCIHHKPLHKNGSRCCHYILDTGLSRDCPAENCDKYKGVSR